MTDNTVEKNTVEKNAGKDDGTSWLVLIYRVPPEPTRLRATIARNMA